MRAVDLTRAISPGMPVYPGTPGPVVEDATRLDVEGFNEKLLTLTTHTGTHMDAPAHLIDGGKTLDAYPPDKFIGKGLVVRLVDLKPGEPIETARFSNVLEQLDSIDFLLLDTGAGKYWGSEGFWDFPVLSLECASWLAGFGLKGIGVDACSFDPINSTDYAIHKTFLSKDILLIENLANLSDLRASGFLLACLPLNIANADGAPVRAVAMED